MPCDTRWNSLYDAAVKSCRSDIKPKLNPLIEQLKAELKSCSEMQLLTNNDWTVVEEYMKIFNPVAKSLDILQGERNTSRGHILPIITSMMHHIRTFQTNSNIGRDFKETMLKVPEKRFNSYLLFQESNRDLIVAAVSHPKYYKISFIENNVHADIAKRMLVEECKKQAVQDSAEQNNAEAESTDQLNSSFIITFAARTDMRRSSLESEIEMEVTRFLLDPDKNLLMLKKYPTMDGVFRKFNTTLASSGAVERLFSQSTMVLVPRRNRISPEKFEQTLLMKYNRKLINYSKNPKFT